MVEKTLEEEIEEAMRAVDGSGPPEPPASPTPAQSTSAEPQRAAQETEKPALAQDSQVSPKAVTDGPNLTEEADQPVPAEPEEPEVVQAGSRTLAGLDETRLPKPEIACGTCPNSVWFATPNDLHCYCRVMFVHTWTAKKPGEIVSCDGMFLGQD